MRQYAVVALMMLSNAAGMKALAGQTPKVLDTVPAANANDVDPHLSQIVVTFDMAVKTDSWSVVQVGEVAFPELVGDEPISFRDNKTCVIKVKLQPETAYGIALNSRTRKGFKSAADETPAEPCQLLFRTGRDKPAEPEGPRVVKTDPPDGAADLEAGTFDLTVVFSEPMKQGPASITTPPDGPHLKIIGKPAWKDARTFVVPVILPPATRYRVGINMGENKRFASAGDGTPAVPREFTFGTIGAAKPADGKRETAQSAEPAERGPVTLKYDYRKGDAGRIKQTSAVELRVKMSTGQTAVLRQRLGLNSIEEVLVAEKGRPVEARKLISEFVMVRTDPETGQPQAVPRLEKPVSVRIDRREETAKVDTIEGDVSDELMTVLTDDVMIDMLPRKAVRVGQVCEPPAESIAKIQKEFDPQLSGRIDLKLTCRRIGPMNVADARNEMFAAKGGGTPVTYIFDVAEFDIDWKQQGKLESGLPFSLTATGTFVFAIDAGVGLRLNADGRIRIEPTQTMGADGQAVTVSGEGTIRSELTFEPIKWSRGTKPGVGKSGGEATTKPVSEDAPCTRPAEAKEVSTSDVRKPAPTIDLPGLEKKADTSTASRDRLPAGWSTIDDKLFGTQVAVPPGWTPRVRGDVAFCVEPDDVPRAGAFFVPMRVQSGAKPENLADGFDAMLGRGLAGYQARPAARPTGESVQRNLTANIGDTPVVGSYRAVCGKYGTGFVMGYLAPKDQAARLQPSFYRILGSYRYSGPRMRLQPFKSAAIELRIPPGWQVRTSEASGTANQDIDWEVTCPQVPGARAFMASPKMFTANWITDVMTGQVDPQLLPLWRNRGFAMVNMQADPQVMQASLAAVLPGLQIVRQQSLDEVRDFFSKLLEVAIQTIQASGGRMTIHAYECLGRRQVQGVEMRSVVTFGMGAMIIPGGIKGTLGLWMTNVRGFEAPADKFAQLAPLLDRVAGSFSYTEWWIREVQKANEEQTRTLRKLYADLNRLDREIFDNRAKTHSAINEMMYDTLTENYGYLNEKSGTIEKIPTDRLNTFRTDGGDVVSPEEVIDKHIPVHDATRLREASADDYMAFDRRVQVWP